MGVQCHHQTTESTPRKILNHSTPEPAHYDLSRSLHFKVESTHSIGICLPVSRKRGTGANQLLRSQRSETSSGKGPVPVAGPLL